MTGSKPGIVRSMWLGMKERDEKMGMNCGCCLYRLYCNSIYYGSGCTHFKLDIYKPLGFEEEEGEEENKTESKKKGGETCSKK